jgi:hypothetical protein
VAFNAGQPLADLIKNCIEFLLSCQNSRLFDVFKVLSQDRKGLVINCELECLVSLIGPKSEGYFYSKMHKVPG